MLFLNAVFSPSSSVNSEATWRCYMLYMSYNIWCRRRLWINGRLYLTWTTDIFCFVKFELNSYIQFMLKHYCPIWLLSRLFGFPTWRIHPFFNSEGTFSWIRFISVKHSMIICKQYISYNNLLCVVTKLNYFTVVIFHFTGIWDIFLWFMYTYSSSPKEV